MGTVSSLAKACLARSTKLSSIRPLRFSSERGSYFDYAEASNLGMYIHVPAADVCEEHGILAQPQPGAATGNAAVVHAVVGAVDAAGAAPWRTAIGASAKRDRKTITTLFIKGNTSLLDEQAIASIMQAVRRRFAVTHGVGFELAAADVTVERLRMLREAGIAHLSIAADPPPRNTRSAAKPAVENLVPLAALKEAAFETVSLAFAFAQPGQTSQQLQCSVDIAFSSGVNHIAIRPFNSREAKRIERKSKVETAPIVEFGCAATTLMGAKFRINAYSIAEYGRGLEAGRLPAATTLKIVERERMLRYLLWAAHGEARLLVSQTRLLRGIGRPHKTKR